MHHQAHPHSRISIESPFYIIFTKRYTYLFFQWDGVRSWLTCLPLDVLLKDILEFLRSTVINNSHPTPTNNSAIIS